MDVPLSLSEPTAAAGGGRQTMAFVLRTRYDKAIRSLRSELSRDGLEVVMDVDFAERIRERLGVKLAKCRLLGVTCPILLLQAAVTDAACLTALPMQLIILEHKEWTKLYVSNPIRFEAAVPNGLGAKARIVAERVLKCLERIGAQQALSAPAAWAG